MGSYEMLTLKLDSSLRNTANPNNPDDVFNRFFRFGNRGIANVSGFRPKSRSSGPTNIESCAFCVLITNFGEREWPDSLDLETGLFTYFGDNRKEGLLHDTRVGGNRLLRHVFENLHVGRRMLIPPFLVFQQYSGDTGQQMKFLGLAAPGASGLSAYDDLVAIWRVTDEKRFQNYRAIFTILNEVEIARSWLEDLVNGIDSIQSKSCPSSWKRWVSSGSYTPLVCTRKKEPRSLQNQQSSTPEEAEILNYLISAVDHREFEFVAVDIVQMMDSRFTSFSVTPRVKDRGRDAIGLYRVGHENHQVLLNAYIEAKFWNAGGNIGVEPMARLLSRIKHRDIGVFVTTASFSLQVQEELIEDNHPVILVSGGDIAKILISQGLNTRVLLDEWIASVKIRAAA